MSAGPGENENSGLAEEAGLRYVSDEQRGYTRRRAGKGFCYYDTRGERITAPGTLQRIKSLVIPPAWTEVWISPHPRGHIQATGRDARGRKQYIYHPDWHAMRDREKFTKTLAFARALPAIRQAVAREMRQRTLNRRAVTATVVRLLETTLIRIGNREYAAENESYGLTTLCRRHVEIHGTRVKFDFIGKGGKRHLVALTDRSAIRIIRQLQELPGQELFQYLDEDGNPHTLGSADVNAYLHEITGENFTAKDFRTWGGTVLAAWALADFETFSSKTELRRNISAAVKTVARQLGNTPAVCRSSYIHPEVIGAYESGLLPTILRQETGRMVKQEMEGLACAEAAVFLLLRDRLENQDAA
jgi:DNA topoisomerase-1